MDFLRLRKMCEVSLLFVKVQINQICLENKELKACLSLTQIRIV